MGFIKKLENKIQCVIPCGLNSGIIVFGIHITILILSFTLMLGFILSYWVPQISNPIIKLDSQFEYEEINEYA